MNKIEISAFELAQRFVGIKEVNGTAANPAILAMLQLDNKEIPDDSVPWCSGFCNWIAWLLRLPRSKNLAARSWLTVGIPITLEQAAVGFDVVILKRGEGEQPGPEVIAAPGHVGWFAGLTATTVLLLAGNQGNSVSVASFPRANVLGVRRLL